MNAVYPKDTGSFITCVDDRFILEKYEAQGDQGDFALQIFMIPEQIKNRVMKVDAK